jgi:molybdopterin-synthase adenylyltransferase
MNSEMVRYFSREASVREIGITGLARLRSAKLAVVGIGGVGSAAAYFLASLGIGKLKLIDQDIIEESNLHRLLGADLQDLHVPKAEAIARKLNARHPWTKTEAIVETLRSENISWTLDDTDLILDGTDNFRTRYLLNGFAFRNHIPYLFTSAIANQGHLSLFNPPATPCLECLLPRLEPEATETCETNGVTPTIVGMVGTLAASEAAKNLLGLPSGIRGHLLTMDLAGPDFVYTMVTRRSSCDVCTGSSDKATEPANVVMLCGDNVANILPQTDVAIDLQSLKTKVPSESLVASSDSVFVYTKPPHQVSVFKTSRLIITNVPTEEAARQVAREVWEEIL